MSRLCAERWNRRRGRSCLQKLSGEMVLGAVAAGIQTIHKTWIAANVVKLAPEIGEEIGVGKGFLLLPVNFLEFLHLVICHFVLRGFVRESRIPRAAIRPVETASKGTGMRECSVDNMRVRKTKDEFPYRDARKQASFADEAVVCGSLKFEQCVQVIGFIGQSRKNTLVVLAIVGGD